MKHLLITNPTNWIYCNWMTFAYTLPCLPYFLSSFHLAFLDATFTRKAPRMRDGWRTGSLWTLGQGGEKLGRLEQEMLDDVGWVVGSWLVSCFLFFNMIIYIIIILICIQYVFFFKLVLTDVGASAGRAGVGLVFQHFVPAVSVVMIFKSLSLRFPPY